MTTDIDWKMLDKSKFFLLGAALFSGVSAALYPVVVLKTRQQVAAAAQISSLRTAFSIQHSLSLTVPLAVTLTQEGSVKTPQAQRSQQR